MTTTGSEPGYETIARCLGRHRRPVGIAAGLAVASVCLDLARPWPVLLVVDNAVNRQPLDQPWATLLAPVAYSSAGLVLFAGLALIGLALVSTVVTYLSAHLAEACAERIGADLRERLHSRLLRLSPGFHDRQRTGDLAGRLSSDVSLVQGALVATLTTLLPRCLTLVGIGTALVAIDPAMALAAVVTVSPLTLLAYDARRKLSLAHLDRRDHQADLAARVTEVIRNVRLVQAFARESHVERAFRQGSQEVARSGLEVADLNARHQAAAAIMAAVGATLVLWIGGGTVLAGQMSIGLLFVLLLYVMGLVAAAGSMTWSTSVLGEGLASWGRLVEMLAGEERGPEEAPVLPSPREGIVFRSVSFAYLPERPVLRGLDLQIPATGSLSIVGPTGAGKSTLLSLLLRLHDPDEGTIEIDGFDLRSFDVHSVRERMAVVPQDPVFFEGSLLENVALGRPGASLAELKEAAHLAQVDELADRLPDGYNSKIGEGGAMLSTGERRRVALARALVRRAPILLLDDPTVGLDLESESRVMAGIRRAPGVRAVVMVTHSLTVAARADRTVTLCDGRIVDAAPAQALAAVAPTDPAEE